MKTFIRWQGNKSKHINKFKHLIPEFSGKYIEPFIGSGAMLLYLQPKEWIINDLNKDLINIWSRVKDNPRMIIDNFKEFSEVFTTLDIKEKLKMCKKMCGEIENKEYGIGRASDYLILGHCSYMGVIFQKNKFDIRAIDKNIYIKNWNPFNDKRSEDLKKASKFLNNTNGVIYNKDYKEVLKEAQEGDFVFLDPPYFEEHNYQFNYNKDEVLDNAFVKELLCNIKTLDTKGVKWIMTQADTRFVRDTFKDYQIYEYPVYRHSKKCYVNELVITCKKAL